MKPTIPHTRRNLLETALGLGCMLATTFPSADGATLYWDGPTAGWDAVANWSTSAAAATPDPAAVPGTADNVIFNIDPVDGAAVVNLNANQLANSLVFNNTGTTTLQGGGVANRVLTIGAGGVTVDAAAGAVTLGSGTNLQNVATTLGATQTWNVASTSPLVLLNPIASTGTLGSGSGMTKTGAGTVWFNNTANTHAINGTLDIQGGKVQTSGDLTLGGLTGSGILENGGPNSKWTFVNTPLNQNFSGTIQNGATAARLGLVKRGTGQLTLSGVNGTGLDNLGIENGRIILPTGSSIGIGGAAFGSVNVGNTGNAANNGVLEITGGTLNAARTTNPGFAVGGGNNGRGFVKVTGGILNVTEQFKNGNARALASEAHACLSVDGGTVTSGSWLVVGLNNDRAILNQTGGTINVSTNRMTIGAGGNASVGLVNLTGGTFNIAAGGNTGIFLGENGTGTLNVNGTAALTLATNGGATSGTMVFGNNATSLAGNLNLLGGTLSTFAVAKGASTAGAVYRANFNGGTLKAAVANPTFFADLANTEAYVYPGGGTIDNNGVAIKISEPLLAPTGNGVSATGLTPSGGGYLYAPLVTITGGGGIGATAVATIDAGGVLTGIQITNPGTGYTSAPTFALVGGGAGNTGALTGVATLVPNTSGGMTFTGSGTTTLAGANTFTGPITVSQGKLALGATHANSISVAAGAGIVVTDPLGSPALLTVPSLSLANGSTVDLELSSFSGTNDTIVVSNPGGLTLGTVGINLYDDGTTNGLTTAGTYTLFQYSGTLHGGTAGLSVANPVLGYNYSFAPSTATEVKVAVSFTDTDGDLMPDLWETANGLNPNNPNDATGPIDYPPTVTAWNSDGDFSTNLEEFQNGKNPNLASSDHLNTDGDQLLDSWETDNFLALTVSTGAGDYDGDLATDVAEFYAGTNPKGSSTTSSGDWPDSDGDFINDAWEIHYFGDLDIDNDADNANDGAMDADSDTFSDRLEYEALSHPVNAAWTPEKSQIIHRWDFNGDLDDAISGVAGVANSPATIVDPNGATASSAVTLSGTDVLLAGGANGASDYVQLGTNLLAGRATPVTIEAWATQVSVLNWSRIWDFGSSDAENFYMSWSSGTNANTSRQEWKDFLTSTVDTANAPYVLNTEYHIVCSIHPGEGNLGQTLVTFYAAPTVASNLGALRGSYSTPNNLVNLSDTLNTLGRSFYAGDNVANARYNDVRIWHGALTEAERELLHDVGADTVDTTDSEPDGLVDSWEIANFGSIAATTGGVDSDGDGFSNAAEQAGRSIPVGPGGFNSVPDDRDGDLLSDNWEVANFTGLAQTGSADPDGDGATNEQEETAGTNPNNATSWPDTDGDLLKDAWEIQYFGDLDIDNDANNSNDGSQDFDLDTFSDSQEFLGGTNPILNTSYPPFLVALPATGTDAASGISSSKVYTHAIDVGNTVGALVINGVDFHQASIPAIGNDGTNNDLWNSIDNTGGRNGPFSATKSVAFDWAQNNANVANIGADGNMYNLLTDFSNMSGSAAQLPAGSSQTWTLGGLTAGTRYSARLYYRPWTLAGARNQLISINGDGNNAVITVNPDESATAFAGYVQYDYTANDSDITLTFTMTNATGSSWHQHAITNEVLPAGDSDNDNLPDAWEVTHFGGTTAQTGTGDAESDGTDNRTEYLLGLDPKNGTQRFKLAQSATVPGSGITLTWPAQSGLTFTVWRSTTLVGGSWIQLGGTITATGATATYTDTTAPSAKAFYRVILTTP